MDAPRFTYFSDGSSRVFHKFIRIKYYSYRGLELFQRNEREGSPDIFDESFELLSVFDFLEEKVNMRELCLRIKLHEYVPRTF